MFCPFEDRYGSPEMRELFSQERRLEIMIEVLKAEMLALIELGILGEDAYPEVSSLSLERIGGIDKIKVLEKETGHEVLALINAVSEHLGEYGSLVALGLSSPDIIDSANSIIIRKALAMLERKIVKLIKKILKLAEDHSSTLILARTHLWPALPTTLEFILVNYAYRLSHVLNLLEKFRRWRCYGKMSGPTGGYPGLGKFQINVEKEALRKLGLRPIDISFQWLPREYYAEISLFLSILCMILGKIAQDLLDMSRPEVNEISFPENPSSSSMPHKRGPLRLERVIGISRSISSLVTLSLNCISESFQGDSIKSSPERFYISHSFLMADQALEDMLWAFDCLKVNKEKVKENVSSYGLPSTFSYNLLKKLCLKGMNRKEAFELVFSLNLQFKNLKDLVEGAKRDPEIRKFLKEEEIEECLDVTPIIEGARAAIERAKKRIKIVLDSLTL